MESRVLEAHHRWLQDRGGERANLREADLRGANLRGANLRGADLSWANLSEADLNDADLSDADMRGANLRGANLRGADLSWANLRKGDLHGASLHGADLTRADLSWANLSEADLSEAELRGADLSGAHLRGAKGIDDIPRTPVPGLAARVLEQIEKHPETWDQSQWHSVCRTAHCCAGWAVMLAETAGREAERRLGTASAAALLLGGAGHPFREEDEDLVRPWLRERAADEAGP